MRDSNHRVGIDYSAVNDYLQQGSDLRKEVSNVEVSDRATKLTLQALSEDLILYEGLSSKIDELVNELGEEYELIFTDDVSID